MTPQEIFNVTLEKATFAFHNSSISKKQKLAGKDWGLSICGTPIQIGETLVIGINWGGGSSADMYKYIVQKQMPSFEEFKTHYNKGDYKFLKRINALAKEYCNIEISEGRFNYSNLCFFRTPDIKVLENKYFEICIPVFKLLIEYIQPKQIISLGTGNIKYLKKYFKTDLECSAPITIEGNSNKVYKGSLMKFNLYNLPHPNAHHLSDDVYKNLWGKIFNSKNDNDNLYE